LKEVDFQSGVFESFLAQCAGMMLDEETIPTYEYIINKLNDY
jgi:hypothetical protein